MSGSPPSTPELQVMSQLLDRAAPSSVALVVDGQSVTYQTLSERTDALVKLLRAKALAPGDRFAFLLPNGLALVCAYLACAHAGLVAVPLSVRLSPAELEFELRDAEPAAVMHASEYASLIEPVADRLVLAPTLLPLAGVSDWPDPMASAAQRRPVSARPADAFAVMYTGGTTGAPRAAVQSHAAWSRSVRNVVAEWELRPTDRHACVLAMSHVSWFTTAAHLSAGASCWLTQRWNPAEVLDLIERVGITTLNVIPTMLSDLVAEAERRPRDVHSLRLLTVAGSPLPPDLHLRARAVFGPVIGTIYGMTETCGPVSFLAPADMHGDRVRSAGRPGSGVEIALLDEDGYPSDSGTEGEIALRGTQMTTRYLHSDQSLASPPGDWFLTGDIGRFDDDGFLYVVDRRKDMVKSGGFNIYPKEVEDVLYTHPDVLEAAVIGVPDVKWMEAVHAFVAPRRGSSVSDAALIAHCRATLAAFKVPKRVTLLPSIPRTALGKFDKQALRALGSADPVRASTAVSQAADVDG